MFFEHWATCAAFRPLCIECPQQLRAGSPVWVITLPIIQMREHASKNEVHVKNARAGNWQS